VAWGRGEVRGEGGWVRGEGGQVWRGWGECDVIASIYSVDRPGLAILRRAEGGLVRC
jgi:hypothetical protein